MDISPDQVQAPPAEPSRFKLWFELFAVVLVAILLIAQALGLFAEYSVGKVLGEWRTGVVLSIGFVAVIGYVRYSAALDRSRSSRDSLFYLAERNKSRIRELKSRLEAGDRPD